MIDNNKVSDFLVEFLNERFELSEDDDVLKLQSKDLDMTKNIVKGFFSFIEKYGYKIKKSRLAKNVHVKSIDELSANMDQSLYVDDYSRYLLRKKEYPYLLNFDGEGRSVVEVFLMEYIKDHKVSDYVYKRSVFIYLSDYVMVLLFALGFTLACVNSKKSILLKNEIEKNTSRKYAFLLKKEN